MAPVSPDAVKEMYDRVCESYHAIDNFRMKLLGLLPVATGTGVFLLLSGKTELVDGKNSGQLSQALGAIGIFGALLTLGAGRSGSLLLPAGPGENRPCRTGSKRYEWP